MFNNIINNIKEKANQIIQEKEEYQNKLNNAFTINKLEPLPAIIRKDISPKPIQDKNMNITQTKAELIIDLIDINEHILEIIYAKELKTGNDYMIVPTTTYIYFISPRGYCLYNYELTAQIIKKGLLSNVVDISNYIFEVFASEIDLNNFINILNNKEYRELKINEKNEIYGTNEIFRTMNQINSGISYDENYNVRFYSKELHKLYNIKEIENYELLLDNSVIQEKKMKANTRLTAAKNSCYEIKIRITPKDNNIFEIPILEKDTMSTMYSNQTDTYIRNLKYARDIMSKLDKMNEELIYGKSTN